MTAKRPPPVGGRTVADDLRDDLKRCEDWVAQIGSGADGLTLLRLLDRVVGELERLERRGVDLRAERGRLETVMAQLRRRDKVLVAQLGPALTTQRPAKARWWWYLEEQVAARRRRWLKRAALGMLVGVGLLALLYLLYDHFLAPPAHIRQANEHFFNGERAVIQEDLTRAIEQFEAVVALDPEHAEAHLWLGVLYQVTGDTGRAGAAFERARAFFDNAATYLLRRGLFYLAVNDTDAANTDALAAIQEAPDRPQGYFLLGNVAEQVGDLELAVASFQQAAELAAATGEVELQVNARMRMATAAQALMAAPEP